MRLALVISSLQGGGAERVMTHLANGWVARGATVEILTFHGSRECAYPLDSRVQRTSVLAAQTVIPPIRVWDRIQGLRSQLRRIAPDGILSFGDKTNVQTLIAARGLGIPVVVSERSDPSIKRLPRAWKVLRRWAYPSATTLAVQTKAVQRWARKRFPTLHTMVIPNPVLAEEGESDEQRDCSVLAVGRLVPEKGFDLLIRAFANVAGRHPNWSLEILGEGPLRPELESLVAQLGVESRIRLPGFSSQPQQRMRTAGLFILPSRIEGFPNALIEAMSQGNAVIAADCHSGPGEIIRDGIDGRLVTAEDVPALSAALQDLMSDAGLRKRLGTAARGVRERFRLTHVLDLWEEAFRGCKPGRQHGKSGRKAA